MLASRSCPSFLLVLGTVAVFGLTGCTSTRPAAAPSSSEARPTAETAQQLRSATERWQGTPYRLGGTNRQGIDCSAFVQVLYRDVLDTSVPRTTRKQAQAGRAIPADEAQPGDLIFFRPMDKQRHVGVYLGNDEFAHASTSQGVTVSRIDEPYWQNAYWMTRRLPSNEVDAIASPTPPPEASTARRAGW